MGDTVWPPPRVLLLRVAAGAVCAAGAALREADLVKPAPESALLEPGFRAQGGGELEEPEVELDCHVEGVAGPRADARERAGLPRQYRGEPGVAS